MDRLICPLGVPQLGLMRKSLRISADMATSRNNRRRFRNGLAAFERLMAPCLHLSREHPSTEQTEDFRISYYPL